MTAVAASQGHRHAPARHILHRQVDQVGSVPKLNNSGVAEYLNVSS
jgi:hypothetical protein